MKSLVRKIVERIGRRVLSKNNQLPKDFENIHTTIYNNVRNYTMTSPERIYCLVEAIKYIEKYKIEGDIVECGVWKGGSMMAAAKMLNNLGSNNRSLYLYDTFEGMPEPEDVDKNAQGEKARSLLTADENKEKNLIWAYSNLETVKTNIFSTNYPFDKIHLIKGKVEDTIPGKMPVKIALLRLDTDWYKSTKHELQHLFPILSNGGILIIDDYGFWQGARKAVDEYFSEYPGPVYLNRIDDTGRIVVKSVI
jgi:hypothetical protein